MRLHFAPLLLAALLVGGCDKLSSLGGGSKDKSADKSSKSDDDDDDEDKPAKKSKKKKHTDDDAEKTAKPAASSAPSAAPTATPAPPANGVASLFTGDPGPATQFQRQKQIPNKPVWIQVVPYWKANTDDPPIEDPWSDLTLTGKEEHASIHLWIQKRNPKGLSDVDVKNNLAWSHVTDGTFQPAVAGTLGQGLAAQIAEGSGKMSTKPTKVWWMVTPMKGDDDLAVFVALRADVYPKLEGEMLAMLRSLKIAGP